jgi:hypothetical protein
MMGSEGSFLRRGTRVEEDASFLQNIIPGSG